MVTDHANLKWLTTMAPQQTKVARWCMSMAEFDLFIEHRKGERNIVPDVLSRHPTKENIPDDNVAIPPENAVISFIIIATTPLNLSMEHLTILWFVYTMHVLCLKPMVLTQPVLLQLQKELSVQRNLKSNIQPQLRPRLQKLVNLKKAHRQTAIFITLKI